MSPRVLRALAFAKQLFRPEIAVLVCRGPQAPCLTRVADDLLLTRREDLELSWLVKHLVHA